MLSKSYPAHLQKLSTTDLAVSLAKVTQATQLPRPQFRSSRRHIMPQQHIQQHPEDTSCPSSTSNS